MRSFSKIFHLLLILLTQFVCVAYAQPLLINEVQYVNRSTIYDADGDTPDWIELYNSGDDAINLKDYRLADKITDTQGWQLPDTILRPDEIILIYASGKNSNKNNEIHSDFRLKLMKEPVLVFDQRGKLIDFLDVQCVPPDKAMGRWPDGADNWKVLAPSPGMSNDTATVEVLDFQEDSLWSSLPEGFYAEELSLILSNSVLDNDIYYTLDGSDPDDESNRYESEIFLKDRSQEPNYFANLVESEYMSGNNITKFPVVRAVSMSEGCPASNEISNTYIINAGGENRYKVPVISIMTDEKNLFDEETGIYILGKHENYFRHGKAWERPMHIEIFDSLGQTVINQDAGIRIHGAGTRKNAQKSFQIIAREEYGESSFTYPMFSGKPNLTSFKTMLIRASNDWIGTLFKDELCNSLVSDMDIDYNATRTSILFLNGEYWGIYSIREKQDKYYIEGNYDVDSIDVDIISYGSGRAGIEDGNIDRYNSLLDWLERNDPADDVFYQNLRDHIDVENLIDYYCAQMYFANTDFPHHNLKLWRIQNDTSKWRWFFFDLDVAMRVSNNELLSDYYHLQTGKQYHPEYSLYIFNRCLQNREFRDQFHHKFLYHLDHAFRPEIVISEIDNYYHRFKSLIPENIYRWNQPEDIRLWASNVNRIYEFAIERPVVLRDQLKKIFGSTMHIFPNPSSSEFRVTFNNEAEKVLLQVYTINGSLALQREYSNTDTILVNHYLSPGIYLVLLKTDLISHRKKLIVQ